MCRCATRSRDPECEEGTASRPTPHFVRQGAAAGRRLQSVLVSIVTSGSGTSTGSRPGARSRRPHSKQADLVPTPTRPRGSRRRDLRLRFTARRSREPRGTQREGLPCARIPPRRRLRLTRSRCCSSCRPGAPHGASVAAGASRLAIATRRSLGSSFLRRLASAGRRRPDLARDAKSARPALPSNSRPLTQVGCWVGRRGAADRSRRAARGLA
jgi:hypothetical protein